MSYQLQQSFEMQNIQPQSSNNMVMYQNPIYQPNNMNNVPPQQYQQPIYIPPNQQNQMANQPNYMLNQPNYIQNQPNYAPIQTMNQPYQMAQPIMMPVQLQPINQQMLQPYQFYPSNGYDKLMVPGIFVKQKVELLEIVTGCETENKYKVYACNVDGEKQGMSLFKAKEKSSWWSRNCLPGDCRPFKIIVEHDSEGKMQNDKDAFLKMNRECACTFLCCGRPSIDVYLAEKGSNKFLGKVLHEYSCCNVIMNIYDHQDHQKYRLTGEYLQCGMFSSQNCICCKSLQQAFFFIEDQNGRECGILEKRGKGFTSLISDADNFALIFPFTASKEDRTLMLAATLFMDFRYFENNTNNQNSNTRRTIF